MKIDAPSITLPNGNKVQLSVSGATAEWIMERPMIPKTTDLAPFADYDCIDFVNCRAFEGSPQDSVLRLQIPAAHALYLDARADRRFLVPGDLRRLQQLNVATRRP